LRYVITLTGPYLFTYLLTIAILNGISLTYYDLPFPENGSQITPGQDPLSDVTFCQMALVIFGM